MKKFNIFKSKKTAVLVVIIFISIITIALSYAFFASFIGGPANTSVGIDSEASEKLIFNKGEDINIYATQENFAEGDGSLSGTTTSNATLIANKSVGTADDIYQIYFDIHINDFEYTVDNATPELLLEITDPSGNKITTLEGFTYKTVIDASTGDTLTGFDITEFEGLIKIKEDEAISTTSYTDGTKEEWSAKITFVNLATNQHLNEGKTLEADFILQKDKLTVNEMISGETFNDLMETSGFRDTVTQIIFDKQIDDGYETATNKWDLSTEGNESVIGYIKSSGEEQILHIQSNRRIIANMQQYKTFLNFNVLTNLELNNWYNTSNVINMSYMFSGLVNLNYLDISSINTSNVENMSYMFSNSGNGFSTIGYPNTFKILDISNFDTSKVTNMSGMFSGQENLKQLDLSSFDTSKVTNMSLMFNDTNSLINLDLSSFNTLSVENMFRMFKYSSSIENLNLASFETSNVTNMSEMFNGCNALLNLDISNFKTLSVENMSSMFNGVGPITYLDLTHLNTSNVTNMSSMFRSSEIIRLNLSNFNTSKVHNMSGMFYDMNNIVNLELSSFDTKKVEDMSSMFLGLDSITTLDLSIFDMSSVTNTINMFQFSTNIVEAYAKTQADADVLNASSNKPTTFTFVATE